MNAVLERWGVSGAIVVLAIVAMIFHFHKAKMIIEHWAAGSGLEIIRSEWSPFRWGPFPEAFFNHQSVYHVLIRDREGLELEGWLKLGDPYVGLLSRAVEVKWTRSYPFEHQ